MCDSITLTRGIRKYCGVIIKTYGIYNILPRTAEN